MRLIPYLNTMDQDRRFATAETVGLSCPYQQERLERHTTLQATSLNLLGIVITIITKYSQRDTFTAHSSSTVQEAGPKRPRTANYFRKLTL